MVPLSPGGTSFFTRYTTVVLQFFEAACGHDGAWTNPFDGSHTSIDQRRS